MIDEPTSKLPPSPFNPYAAPHAEAAEVTAGGDDAFHPHGVLVLCGGFLGLLAAGLHLAVSKSVTELPPIFAVLSLLEVGKGILAGMGVGILVDSLLQRKFSRLAPGHWFLVLVVANLAAQAGASLWADSPDLEIGFTSFGSWYFAQTMIHHGLSLVLMTPIVLASAEPLRWRALAWGIVAHSVLSLLQFPLAYFDQVMAVIVSVLMVTATLGGFLIGLAMFALVIVEFAVDRQRAKSRDLCHWLGIFGPVGLTFLMIVLGMGFGNV